MNPKPWYQSRTIIVNLVAGLIETLQLFADERVLDPGVVMIVCNTITVWLRIYTDQPIGTPPPGDILKK